MTKELYHFHFRHKHDVLNLFLLMFVLPSAILFLFMLSLELSTTNKSFSEVMADLWGIFSLLLLFGLLFALFIAWHEKSKGEDIPEDEFILYDNGWFTFWNITPDEGWIAPAKIDWIYPEGTEIKALGMKKSNMYLLKKKKNGMYKIGFGLEWAYPDKRWENWVFNASVGGWLTEEEYHRFLEMIDMLNQKGKENIQSGRIKPPGKNWKQEHMDYYQRPWFWNEVFKKENIREVYKKDTGEDIPEPVRSFMYDYPTFSKIYLKNKRETGDWLGKKEVKG